MDHATRLSVLLFPSTATDGSRATRHLLLSRDRLCRYVSPAYQANQDPTGLLTFLLILYRARHGSGCAAYPKIVGMETRRTSSDYIPQYVLIATLSDLHSNTLLKIPCAPCVVPNRPRRAVQGFEDS